MGDDDAGRRRRRCDFQVALVIKTGLRNRDALIRRQFGLGLGKVRSSEQQQHQREKNGRYVFHRHSK